MNEHFSEQQAPEPRVSKPQAPAQPAEAARRRRVIVWGAAALAAVLAGALVCVAVSAAEERNARDAYRAAVARWQAIGGDAAPGSLSSELQGLDGEIAAARELAAVLPEALVGVDARTALEGAATAAQQTAAQHGGAGDTRGPASVAEPEDAAKLRAATQRIEAAIAAREGAAQSDDAALAAVTEQRRAVVAAVDTARGALVTVVADQAAGLTGASAEARQALAAAGEALTAAPVTEAAASATALTAALDAARAEHEAAAGPAAAANIDDPASIAVVVNKQRPLQPISWEPGDLRMPAGIPNPNGQPLRAEAATALEAMYAEAAAAGVPFIITSGYRGYGLQTSLFESYTARDGLAAAETYSARPGHSEHQTGLAADLDDGSGCSLDSCFGDTAAGRWLRENAHRFGFILRYDAGQQPVVGFIYEPWHFRYVGAQVAGDMRARGIANLEDYFGLPAAPTY